MVTKNERRTDTTTSGRYSRLYNVLRPFWCGSVTSQVDYRVTGREYKGVLGEGPEHGRCCDIEWSTCQNSTSGHVEDDVLCL
jgi:hypothetical protein